MPYTPGPDVTNDIDMQQMIRSHPRPSKLIVDAYERGKAEQSEQAARDARLRQGVEQLRDAMRFNIRTVYLTQDLEAKLTALLAETETP